MKAKKPSILQTGGADIDLGADFYIEMRGRKSLAVYSCRGIAEYSPARIVLHLLSTRLCIIGSGLLCDSYTNGAVLVSGLITSIEFIEEE